MLDNVASPSWTEDQVESSFKAVIPCIAACKDEVGLRSNLRCSTRLFHDDMIALIGKVGS